MRFYTISILLAFLQASLITGLFASNLYVPDIVLVYLFIYISRNDRTDLKKPLISGLYLDIMYDTFGWNMSGKLFSAFLLELLKSRWIFATRLSLIVSYAFIAFCEHLLRYFLFRLKYYYPFETHLFLTGIAVELSLLFVLTYIVIKENTQGEKY
ncbi:MAG: hypothetical protein ABWK04_07115 [Hydrogenobacter sp.]